MDLTSIKCFHSHPKIFDMKNVSFQNSGVDAKINTPAGSFEIVGLKNLAEETPQNNTNNELLSRITAKLEAGKELSPDELEYLRKNAPQVYENAVRMSKEMEVYEEQLQQCKTKNDVRTLHMLQMHKMMVALRDNNPISSSLPALTRVFTKFTASNEFAALAKDQLELIDAIKAEKESKAVNQADYSDKTEDEQDENKVQNPEDTDESQDTGDVTAGDHEQPAIETEAPKTEPEPEPTATTKKTDALDLPDKPDISSASKSVLPQIPLPGSKLVSPYLKTVSIPLVISYKV